MFFTGGTISMRFDPALGGAVPALSPGDILGMTGDLAALAQIETHDVARLPGPHMTPARMLDMAHRIAEVLRQPGITGAVVTHGTDTLEETACLVDLVLGSGKPVVFTGAMRSSSDLSWDGPANLRAALRVAADPACQGLGSVVVWNDRILAAADVTKTHTESVDTFQERDLGCLGLVDRDRILMQRRQPVRPPFSCERLEEAVEVVKLSAGSDGRMVGAAIGLGARGLVIEGLGRGNVPITALPEVLKAIDSGIPVVITSRCPRGRVLDTYAYEGAGRGLRQRGAILGGLLPGHKARIRLMLLIGAGKDREAIRTSFEECPANSSG